MSAVVTRVSERAFVGVVSLLFAAGTAATVVGCLSMASMDGMQMPGGWTMSMAWMRMPDQSWPGAAASFLGMWIVMMMAMMLPALLPMLRRYRAALVAVTGARLGRLTLLVGVAYFSVWTLAGAIVFPLGVALATMAMRSPEWARAVPLATASIVIAGGALQFTAWKSRQLACCRETPGLDAALDADAGTAWRHGVRLGIHCGCCCAGLTAILLAVGVMDLAVMAIVTAAISLERLAHAGQRIARATGAVVIAAGVFLMARAAGV